MIENTDKLHVFDPAIQTENIAFTAQEMVACDSCGRMNPPNRSNCLYCAHGLAVSADQAADKEFIGRNLDGWERGFNVIFVRKTGAETNVKKATEVLRFDISTLAEILETEIPLPIARVESEIEAGVIRDRLEQNGLTCAVVSDDDLRIDKPHVRLSGIEFLVDKFALVNFNTGKKTIIDYSDLSLIVSGSLTKGRVDSLEKKRRHGKTKLIDEMATSSDEHIVDLYIRVDATGFRINRAGFDFSCLGDAKTLLASENIQRLIDELIIRSSNAKHIISYDRVKNLIGDVWELESRKDSGGLQRSGFGKVEFGSVASTSNLTQFNKFSRLQWHLR